MLGTLRTSNGLKPSDCLLLNIIMTADSGRLQINVNVAYQAEGRKLELYSLRHSRLPFAIVLRAD
jgi:hypothetical protein